MTRRKLHERLARVEALLRGATTPGEREAAARARERVKARIAALPADRTEPPDLHLGPPELPSRVAPRTADALAAITRWETGRWSRRRIQQWAQEIVDTTLLDADPRTEEGVVAEVVLELATGTALRSTDAAVIRRFLRDRDWAEWFALLARPVTPR